MIRARLVVDRVTSAAMRIDLHTHSTLSDGTLTPTEVIEAAHAVGLDAVALTDHDGVDGWPAAAAAAELAGIVFVPGVELSCRWYDTEVPIPLHLLAYYVDPAHAGLAAEMARVREVRDRRAEMIIERMRADGVDVTWEEVQGYAAGGAVGRPHLAQALIRRGLAATVSEAFVPAMLGERWRVPKADTDLFQALALVLDAGGVPVFAHPRATKRGRVLPDEVIVAMAAAGLFGLEADHEDHSPEQREEVRALARDLGLVVTGSSDFHGANKTVRLGANLTAPAVLTQIQAAARSRP
jgi:predicted metal-dependent phosphoesterase TrpH